MEQKIKEVLTKLDGELAGTYKSLTEMSYDERNYLIEQHFLFNDADDKYLNAANGYNDWPVCLFYINLKCNLIICLIILFFLERLGEAYLLTSLVILLYG